MVMEFNPENHIVQLCLQGIKMQDAGHMAEAEKIFMQAWNEAVLDFERLIAAYYVARSQENAAEELKWLETALEIALKTSDEGVKSALPSLYSNIVCCHEALQDPGKAAKHLELAERCRRGHVDQGPFFHGTRADLPVGDFLTAGGPSNYKLGLHMNHVYFTASLNGAGLAAALAKGTGQERIYRVEPTGAFENDPNVTDKKFPGNLTRSYRSVAPLRVVGEVANWARRDQKEIQKWRGKIADSDGEIIN